MFEFKYLEMMRGRGEAFPIVAIKAAIMFVAWMTLPIFLIGGGVVTGLGVALCFCSTIFGYLWFMWGAAALLFDHDPGGKIYAISTLIKATGWSGMSMVMLFVLRFIGFNYFWYLGWVKAGGFFAKQNVDYMNARVAFNVATFGLIKIRE